MLIVRCAWHPTYHGRHKTLRIVWEWRKTRLALSDGMCAACAARFREELRELRAQRLRIAERN